MGQRPEAFTSTPRYFAAPPEAPISGRGRLASRVHRGNLALLAKTVGDLSLCDLSLPALFLRN